jgi:hypothetical protein
VPGLQKKRIKSFMRVLEEMSPLKRPTIYYLLMSRFSTLNIAGYLKDYKIFFSFLRKKSINRAAQKLLPACIMAATDCFFDAFIAEGR